MATRIICFGDIHFPHHDPLALSVVQKTVEWFDPHRIVLLGDILDCGMFSRHPSGGVEEVKHSYLKDEVEPAKQFITSINGRDARKRRNIVFIEGNHENRVSRWCAERGGSASESLNEVLSPKAAFARHVNEWIPYLGDTNQPSFADLGCGLAAVHGWSFCRDAAAKHLSLSRSRSVIFGHTHRAQAEYGRDPWTKQPIQARSSGCLCKLQPLYLTGGTPSQWVHGVTVIYMGTESFTAYTVEINGNTLVMPDGHEVKV